MVSGPPLITRCRCGVENDFTTESGPRTGAKRLGAKLAPNHSPLRRPSGEAPSSRECQM